VVSWATSVIKVTNRMSPIEPMMHALGQDEGWKHRPPVQPAAGVLDQ